MRARVRDALPLWHFRPSTLKVPTLFFPEPLHSRRVYLRTGSPGKGRRKAWHTWSTRYCANRPRAATGRIGPEIARAFEGGLPAQDSTFIGLLADHLQLRTPRSTFLALHCILFTAEPHPLNRFWEFSDPDLFHSLRALETHIDNPHIALSWPLLSLSTTYCLRIPGPTVSLHSL